MSPRLLIGLAVVAAPILALAACNAMLAAHDRGQVETTHTLHREARALVPPNVRIVGEEESACRMLRSFPSCVLVFLDWRGTFEKRRRALESQLRERGWRPAPDRPSFVFARDGLEASIFVNRQGDEWEKRCSRRDPTRLDRYDRDRCLDTVRVSVT